MSLINEYRATEEAIKELKARLEDSEKALVQFATQEQIVSVGDDKPSLSAQNLSELNASLAKAQDYVSFLMRG